MNIKQYQPWSLLQELQKEFNDSLSRSLTTNNDLSTGAISNWSPAVDIKEDPNKFVLLADLPGLTNKDIKVTMEKGVLTIQGERKSEVNEGDKSQNRRVERYYGFFMRQFVLPDTTDSNNISAKFKNGVLEVSIPKTEKAISKHIEITVE